MWCGGGDVTANKVRGTGQNDAQGVATGITLNIGAWHARDVRCTRVHYRVLIQMVNTGEDLLAPTTGNRA